MNDGKLGSSFSSFVTPSSALLILCCILSLRTYIYMKDPNSSEEVTLSTRDESRVYPICLSNFIKSTL